MSTEAEKDDVVGEIEAQDDDRVEAVESEGDSTESEAQDADEGEEDEVVISIGDAPPASTEGEPEARAPQWVRDLRKAKREQDAELRELKRKLAEKEQGETPTIQEVKKPTLEDCDYDADEYERKYDAWAAQKRQQDEVKRQKEAEQKAVDDAWKVTVDGYNEAKAKLKVHDFEDAEHEAQSVLNQTQIGIILHGAKVPAQIIYALGKNPAELKKLAAISDPVKFTFAIAELQTNVKVTPKKAPASAPEKTVRGNTTVSGAVDSTLDRLRADADRTGDRTKVAEYMRNKRKAA